MSPPIARQGHTHGVEDADAAMQQPQPASSTAETERATPTVVVTYATDPNLDRDGHEWVSCTGIAQRLALLKRYDFAGHYDPSRSHPQTAYFVPNQTLVGLDKASQLGIRGEHDLFGGVVPYPFLATKVISHGLIAPDAPAPEGWSHQFCEEVRHAVLSGFSVFSLDDARRAGAQMLQNGPIRLKPARETGGRGQTVVSDPRALEAALTAFDPGELASDGLVLEENLSEVATYSVGQVRVGAHVASYYGTQRLTSDNKGESVYGGSDLAVLRGGWSALLAMALPGPIRAAVAQARIYDQAATAHFPGLIASRRNYDVAQGIGADGRPRTGVLEQSWRLGGASGAEIAALEAFASDPALQVVQASTVEIFGAGASPPEGATVYFCGIDRKVGPITKFTRVERHGDER
jgi:hypothetical protein